jgi:pimeloyl-ACP methyl ester carboxylesterase
MSDTAAIPWATDPWTPDSHDYLRIRGRECHVLDQGHGPPILVLHGLGSVAEEIALPLRPLTGRYRLIIPDRPGYGSSSSLHQPLLRPEDQVTWLRGIVQRTGIRRPIIVAHSIGSAVALCYALRFPTQVAGLVLIAPFCRPTRPARMPLLRIALMPVIGRFVRSRVYPWLADHFGRGRLAAAFAPNSVPDYFSAMPLRTLVRPDALLTMAAELFGFNPAMQARRKAFRALDVPTIVLAGEADTVADPDRHAAWVAQLLPHARLVRLPGVGHMLQHIRPDAVMQAIDDVAREADAPLAAAAD